MDRIPMGNGRNIRNASKRLARLLRAHKLARLKKIGAIDEDEEDYDEDWYQELAQEQEEQDEEERRIEQLEEEPEFEEDPELWQTALQDPEGELHNFLYENSEGYREFFDRLIAEREQNKPAEQDDTIEEEREEAKEEVETSKEERLEEFNAIIQDTESVVGQFLNLSKEEAAVLLQEEQAYTLEELQKEDVLANPAELVKVADPYREFIDTGLVRHRAILDRLTNNDPLESDRLGRAFFSYIPSPLLREYYNIGLEDVHEGDLPTRIDKQLQGLEAYDNNKPEMDEQFQEKVGTEDFEKFTVGIRSLDEIRETAARIMKDAKQTIETVDDLEDPRFKVTSKQLLQQISTLINELSTLRDSFPDEVDYGIQLDEAAAPLAGALNGFQEFLVNPSSVKKIPATSFLAWHNKYDLHNVEQEKFNQLYGMILYYAGKACARQLYYYPQIAKAPGVDAGTPQERASNLMTAVLYGLNLHHTEVSQRESEALRNTDYAAGQNLDKLLDDPVLRERTLNDMPAPQRIMLQQKLRVRERHRNKVNLNDSVLNRIHKHITQTGKTHPVCPKCNSSWWSFQSDAFPNASSEIFNTNILPRLSGKSPEIQEEVKKVRDSLFHEWRESPFKAPVGIYLGKEGRLCGGMFDGADIDLVLGKLQNAHANLEKIVSEKEQAISEHQPGAGFSEGYFDGPFLEEDLQRGQVTVDPDKTVQIVLPDATNEEIETNIALMDRAISSAEKVDKFKYGKRTFLISKEDFNAMREEIGEHLCLHPKRQSQQSLAQLINVAVKSSTLKAMKTLPAYAGQRVVNWVCPECGTRNKVPVDIGVIERKADSGEFQSFPVVCENLSCDQRYHMLGDTKRELSSYRRAVPQSIDYQVDEESGSIADTLEAPETGQEALAEIEEVGKEHQQQRDQLISSLNKFGAEKTWEVMINPRTRSKIDISLPRLGTIVFDVLGDLDITSLTEADGSQALTKVDEKTLSVANKLGFVFPFAVCKTCNTIHPKPITKGSLPRCIHVERTGLAKKISMNDVARIFKEILRTNPTYPTSHQPDFDHWRTVWDSQFRSAAIVKQIRKGAIDPDEEDFDLLGEDLESIIGDSKKKVDPEDDPFASLLEGVEEAIEKEPESEEEFSEDDFFDAAFGEDSETEEEKEEAEQVSKDTEKTTEDPDLEDTFGGEEFFEIAEEPEGKEKRPQDAFEVQTLEAALQVLPISEREKVWGSNIEGYYSGTDIEQIPQDVIKEVLDTYNIQTIVAIVDNPLEVVNTILDDAKTHLMQIAKDVPEED